MTISSDLNKLISSFSINDPKAAANLTNALNSSSALTDQLNAEVALGVLKGFSSKPLNGAGANADNTNGVVTFNSTIFDSTSLSIKESALNNPSFSRQRSERG